MRTILIPVDFTGTSENAADFAVSWSKKYGYDRIILLKTFYESMFELLIVSEGHSHVNHDLLNSKREEAAVRLEEMRVRVAEKTGVAITVETRVSELPLLRSILQVIAGGEAELIIVGSDNQNHSGDSLVAGRIIAIAKTSPVKVLIVPLGYTYRPIQDVLVPCDIKTLMTLEKLERLKKDSKLGTATLHLLHVDKEGLPTEAGYNREEANANEFLKDFSHEFHYISNPDIISGILSFSQGRPMDLVIALPGKHSFFYYLTNKSISEAIYKNARQPVLILK